MNYITEIFERANLQHIREFLLHGVECGELAQGSFKERVKNAETAVFEQLHLRYPIMEDYEQATGELFRILTVYEEVYLEIGLQIGLILAAQVAGARG